MLTLSQHNMPLNHTDLHRTLLGAKPKFQKPIDEGIMAPTPRC